MLLLPRVGYGVVFANISHTCHFLKLFPDGLKRTKTLLHVEHVKLLSKYGMFKVKNNSAQSPNDGLIIIYDEGGLT